MTAAPFDRKGDFLSSLFGTAWLFPVACPQPALLKWIDQEGVFYFSPLPEKDGFIQRPSGSPTTQKGRCPPPLALNDNPFSNIRFLPRRDE